MQPQLPSVAANAAEWRRSANAFLESMGFPGLPWDNKELLAECRVAMRDVANLMILSGDDQRMKQGKILLSIDACIETVDFLGDLGIRSN